MLRVWVSIVVLWRHERKQILRCAQDDNFINRMLLAGEVELGDFEVAGLGDLEVALVAGDDEDGDAGAL